MTKYSLVRLGIRAVVNCAPNLPNHFEEQQAISPNQHKEKSITYLRFPIGKWKAHSGEDDALLQTFLATFLQLNIFKTKKWPCLDQLYHFWNLVLDELECI